MSLDFKCPECQAGLRVKEEHAGKKMKCPKCAKIVPIPAGKSAADEEIYEDVEVVEDEPADLFDFDASEETASRPRQGRRKAKSGRISSQFMPCPHCGARDAVPVLLTWWGSFYGPKLFHHVRCQECGGTYNGKTGDTNLIAAIGFVVVTLILFAILIITGYVMLKRKGIL